MWFGHVLIIHRQRQSTPGRVRRCRHNKAGNGWEKSHDILKRRLQASCLWSLGILAKFRYCQGWGNGGCPRDVFIRIPLASIYGFLCLIICSKGLLYSYRRGLQRCTLKDDISYLLPTWLSAGTGKLKRKHHFIGWQERTNKMKNKSCATNFATQQPFSLLLLLQEPFLLAERKKMCYLSMAANQSQYTNINSFILGYIY